MIVNPKPGLISGAVALLFFMLSCELSAQTATHGALDVSVRDSAGIAVGGVTIVVRDVGGSRGRKTTTSADGRVSILLAAGEYTAAVERLGSQPLLVSRIPIVATHRTPLQLTLHPAQLQANEPDHIVYATAAGAIATPSELLFRTNALELPDRSREMAEMLRLSAAADVDVGARFVIDGIPFRTAATPFAASRPPAFSSSAFQSVSLVNDTRDVVFSDFGGLSVNALTHRGERGLSGRATANWAESRPSVGLRISGPIQEDTAHFTLGIEAQQLRYSFTRPWTLTDNIDEQVIAIARDSFNLPLDSYIAPNIQDVETIAAFAGADWQFGERHSLSAHAHYGRARGTSFWTAPYSISEDVAAGATWTAELQGNVVGELRVGFDRSVREFGQSGNDEPLPSAHVITGAIRFGNDVSGRYTRSALQAIQAFYVSREQHYLKLGLSAALVANEQADALGRGGEAFFGSPDYLARREGMFVQTFGSPPEVSFTTPKLALFAQDRWSLAPYLTLDFGLRYEIEQLPTEHLPVNVDWVRLSGIPPTPTKPDIRSLSPHVALRWSAPQRGWQFDAAASIRHDEPDALLFGELLWNDGTVRVRRSLSRMTSWPAVPDTIALPVSGSMLTLAPSEFETPQTLRASMSLFRTLGRNFRIGGGAVHRATTSITRYFDLNRGAAHSTADQYGRALFGELQQHGELLAATPLSSRRFTQFDVVAVPAFDGESQYSAVNLQLERLSTSGPQFFARYSLSRTRDNLIGPRDRGTRHVLAANLDTSTVLSTGLSRSDYDVPHRAVLGGEIPFAKLRIAAAYRYESGRTFTPGFRDGVDANGDGVAHNDPAFIDNAVTGVSDLTNKWSCLSEQAGRFAARNSCRMASVHSLDLRLTVGLLKVRDYRAALIIDAFNIVESDLGYPDAALYLVDSASSVTRNGKTVGVPLIANPHFGQPLLRQTVGRQLRAELRLSY